MHCPGCGVQASLEQKFCRSCGLSLEKVPELLQSKRPGAPASRTMEGLATAGLGAFLLGGGALLLYILYNIVTKVVIDKGQVLFGSALFLLLIGAILLLSYVFYSASQKDEAKRKSEWEGPEVPGAETNRRLSSPGYNETIESVTDSTTDLLEVPATPRKRDT